MLYYCQTKNKKDLQSILDLSRQNLKSADIPISDYEEGFITVPYEIEELEMMSSIHSQLVVKDRNTNGLVGYALLLDRKLSKEIPYLVSFFDQVNALEIEGKKLSEWSYIVMGQICIHEDYRSKGLFRGLYREFVELTKDKFDYVITEINANNTRSLRAHNRVGFQTILEFTSEDKERWHIVMLPTNKEL